MASIDDLWLVDVGQPYPGEPAHHRPALIIGPARSFGDDLPFAIVCPLTSTRRGLSLHVEVEPGDDTGLDRTSYVQCEQLRSIRRQRLVHRLGRLGLETSRRVHDVVRILLDH